MERNEGRGGLHSSSGSMEKRGELGKRRGTLKGGGVQPPSLGNEASPKRFAKEWCTRATASPKSSDEKTWPTTRTTTRTTRTTTTSRKVSAIEFIIDSPPTSRPRSARADPKLRRANFSLCFSYLLSSLPSFFSPYFSPFPVFFFQFLLIKILIADWKNFLPRRKRFALIRNRNVLSDEPSRLILHLIEL